MPGSMPYMSGMPGAAPGTPGYMTPAAGYMAPAAGYMAPSYVSNGNYYVASGQQVGSINNISPASTSFAAITIGTTGNDTMNGDAQNTNFFFERAAFGGTDVIIDAGGVDRLTFSTLSDATIDLTAAADPNSVTITITNLNHSQNLGTMTVTRSIEQLSASDGTITESTASGSGNFTLEGVMNISVGQHGYILAGTSTGDTIDANALDLVNPVGVMIFGLNGDDVLAGYSTASNIIFGGGGNDTITGGSVSDKLYGNGGNDTINGNGGDDSIFGGSGNDTISGGPGNDSIDLGGPDSLGNGGSDVVKFSGLAEGSDFITSFDNSDINHTQDQVKFVGDAKTALDDGGNGNLNVIQWGPSSLSGSALVRVDVTNGHNEAVYIDARSVGPGNLGWQSMDAGNSLGVYLGSNAANFIHNAGADALVVVATNDNKTLIYSYSDADGNMQPSDFSLVAQLDVALTSDQAHSSIVLG